MDYMIRKAGEKTESMQEPIVGKWYVGVEVDYDQDCERHGDLVKFEEDGCFYADTADDNWVDMDDYEYLQEQL